MGSFLKAILASKAVQFEWLPGEVKSAPLEVFQQGLVSHLAGILWKESLHRVRKGEILSNPQDSSACFAIARSRDKICRDACELFAFMK